MDKEKVLIVDDDVAIQKLLYKIIIINGFQPVITSSGEEALLLLKKDKYKLILLDLKLKEMDGFMVLKRIKNFDQTTPIMIVSGSTEDYDTLHGLDLGADDYVSKPFSTHILGAKIKALIRRASLVEKKVDNITLGPFKFNLLSLKFYKNEEEIFLSSKEIIIIKLLISNIDKVFSKEEIYKEVWGTTIVDESSINVYINHIRAKIEDDKKNPVYLKTVWGLGYKFSDPLNNK